MPRPRSIPDSVVFAHLRQALASGGERATSFALIARATGLAASSLAQRYGSRDEMVRRALHDGWDELEARLQTAATAPLTAKGVTQLLKSLARPDGAEIRLLLAFCLDEALTDRAQSWRGQVEAALALRLPGPANQARAAAAILFAAWQGRLLWNQPESAHDFRLKDVLKLLA